MTMITTTVRQRIKIVAANEQISINSYGNPWRTKTFPYLYYYPHKSLLKTLIAANIIT